MTTKTQLWSPDTCECVFEEIYELEDPDNTKRIFFAHNVCSKHEPIALTKKLSKKEIEDKQIETLDTVNVLLKNNRDKNVSDLKNHPKRVKTREAIKEMKKSARLEQHALLLESKLDAEEYEQSINLDRFENERKVTVTQAIISPHAFTAQDVYEKVKQEQRDIAVAKNGS